MEQAYKKLIIDIVSEARQKELKRILKVIEGNQDAVKRVIDPNVLVKMAGNIQGLKQFFSLSDENLSAMIQKIDKIIDDETANVPVENCQEKLQEPGDINADQTHSDIHNFVNEKEESL